MKHPGRLMILTVFIFTASLMKVFAAGDDSLLAVNILQKISERNKTIRFISYEGQRIIISHGDDDSIYKTSGTIWMQVLPRDTIFGARFHLKGSDSRETLDYFYDGQLGFEFRHTSKTLSVFNPYGFPNNPNNPAKARTALGPLQPVFTDTALVETFMNGTPATSVIQNPTGYYIDLVYPPNAAGALIKKRLTVVSEGLLLTQVRTEVSYNGSVQTQIYTGTNFLINNPHTQELVEFTDQGPGYKRTEKLKPSLVRKEDLVDLAGSTAPDFSYVSFGNETVRLSSMKGNYVLLDFWESWCGYCIQAIPEMKSLHAQFGNRGLVILGITVENRNKIQDLIRKNSIPYMTLKGDEKILSDYKVTGRPTYVLINPEGKIVSYGGLAQAIEFIKKIPVRTTGN